MAGASSRPSSRPRGHGAQHDRWSWPPWTPTERTSASVGPGTADFLIQPAFAGDQVGGAQDVQALARDLATPRMPRPGPERLATRCRVGPARGRPRAPRPEEGTQGRTASKVTSRAGPPRRWLWMLAPPPPPTPTGAPGRGTSPRHRCANLFDDPFLAALEERMNPATDDLYASPGLGGRQPERTGSARTSHVMTRDTHAARVVATCSRSPARSRP